MVVEQVVVLPVAESIDNVCEGGPLHGHLVPALEHKRVGPLRAVVGREQELSVSDHLDGLRVGAARVGLTAVVEDLPQAHAERPDVRLLCVAAVEERLWRHPAHGQHLHLEFVVVLGVLFLVLGDQVDADLDGEVVGHEDVAGGEVLEDEVLAGQVLHAGGDLLADVEEVGHVALLLLQVQVVGAHAADA